MTWQNLIPYLPSAVAISIVAYFVRFFGKAIADQIPYADNRDWSIELAGLWFFVDFLFPPVIIAAALLSFFKSPIVAWFDQISTTFAPISYHWLNIVIVFMAWIYYAGASTILLQERYKVPDAAANVEDPTIFKKRRKHRFDLVMKINAVLLQPSAMLLIFVAGVEILSGSVLWITVFAVQLFAALVGIALNYLLMRHRLPIVNIHFVSKRKALDDVLLLKLNPDTVRVRNDDRVLIINRNTVSEIEFIDAKQEAEVQRHIVPFTLWIPWLLALDAFWWHRLGLGLLVGLVIPIVIAVISIAFTIHSPEAKKITEQLHAEDPNETSGDVDAAMKAMPLATKIGCAGAVVGSVATIIGAIGAWQNNLVLLIWLGVVIPFVAWAILQIAGWDGLIKVINAIKKENSGKH